MMRRFVLILAWLILLGTAGQVFAAQLPQDHEYQRVLRQYLATLTEKNFTHGVTEHLTVEEPNPDPEYQYRMYIMTKMHQPLVGWKRGIPAVNAPAWLFLLSNIEGPDEAPSVEEATAGFEQLPGAAVIRPGPIPTPTGIVKPPVWPETLVAFTEWDYPGNPFHGNRALKMRAFVTAAVRLMMLDQHLGAMTNLGRSDWNAYRLVTFSSAYLGVKDLLPAEVQQAYEEGLRRLARRILTWGIKGEEPNLDMTAPIGLWYASEVLNDPEFTREAEAYARQLMTDPRYFHPAGYWVERGGGLDVGFAGSANLFAVWTALASDWPFAKETVERAYRLRSHLAFPEPDGLSMGPSHFNSRIGTAACDDEWQWYGARDLAAAMVTDEAASSIPRPTAEDLAGAAANRVDFFNDQIYGSQRNPYNSFGNRYGYIRDEDIRGSTWQWRLWDSYNFPVTVNPGYAFYRPGAYAHLKRLEQEDSPLLKSPYLRGENFLRNFENVFVTTRQPAYGAILYTGPVGEQDPNDGMVQYQGPFGFGGGQLSGFWTPATGSVLLGRRRGMSYGKNFDDLESWRLWPIHAVSGSTPEGKVFSTARILQPEVDADLEGGHSTVSVHGVIPAEMFEQGTVLTGRIDYRRTFTIEPEGLRVETKVAADGADTLAELYETLPVFLREARKQAKTTPTAIEFQVGDQWAPATAEYQDQVAAIRLTRFAGAVEIRFDTPQRVKLAPEEWSDTYITRAACRTILIDLLGNDEQPQVLSGERSVAYTIQAAAKP